MFRVDHYYAYYRLVKRRLEEAVESGVPGASSDATTPRTYPEPCPQCDICNWFNDCRERRLADDHLSLVAGITKLQRTELDEWGITTLTQLCDIPLEAGRRPKRATRQGLEKVQKQAHVQLEGRRGKHPHLEKVLPVVEGEGLTRLPAPRTGDVFFDIEGDAFAGDTFTNASKDGAAGGLEYLFGWVTLEDGEPGYQAMWAYDGTGEKQVFERFMDAMVEQRRHYPDMHIYHYATFLKKAETPNLPREVLTKVSIMLTCFNCVYV